MIFDVQRTGPSTGMPTRTQQGDLMMCAYASHGDTRHICLYPVGSARSLRVRGRRVRPRRALPDAGLRAQRPRHRHERLDDAEADVGRQLSTRSRQGALGRAAREGEDASTATSTSTATAFPYRTLPGVHPKGAYFTRGSGHNKLRRATPKTPPNTPKSSIASTARSSARPGPCRRRSSRQRRAPSSGWSRSADATRPASKRSTSSPRTASSLDYMRVRGFPFGDEVAAVPRLARDQLRRRAEPRRAAAQPADARDRASRSRSSSRCATTAASR